MRKTLTIGLAAITAAVGVLGAGASANARDYYDRYGRYHRDRDNDDALAAGIVGLALGAALASGSSGRGYYSDRYYGRGYYGRGYYDGGYYGRSYYGTPRYYGRSYYRECRTDRYWDPYYGRYIRERRCW